MRARRSRLMRTAKSCGSGAAVLALSPREAKLLGGDGGKRAVLREEHEVSRKSLRREGRNAPAALYARVHFCLRKSHARPRVQQAPGLPFALYFEEGQTKMQTSGAMRREIAKLYPPSLRAQRSNPLSPRARKDGLLRFARNDAERL